LATKSALTWRQGWRSGQWHPIFGQHQVLGATELGFARSVLHFLDSSSFDRELVLHVGSLDASVYAGKSFPLAGASADKIEQAVSRLRC